MSYVDKIHEIVNGLDLGEPVFNVTVATNAVRANHSDWNPGLDATMLMDKLITQHIHREYDEASKAYKINADYIIESTRRHILKQALSMFSSCSAYKQPRRTKVYKDFHEMLLDNQDNEKFINSLYDIYEYFHDSTATETNHENDVHRKNVYQLLLLMEKSYGKKRSKQ